MANPLSLVGVSGGSGYYYAGLIEVSFFNLDTKTLNVKANLPNIWDRISLANFVHLPSDYAVGWGAGIGDGTLTWQYNAGTGVLSATPSTSAGRGNIKIPIFVSYPKIPA